jgi:hypothetical protein
VRTAFIIRAMTEAVSTSETSVNIYLTTRQYIAEDSKQAQKMKIYTHLPADVAQLEISRIPLLPWLPISGTTRENP